MAVKPELLGFIHVPWITGNKIFPRVVINCLQQLMYHRVPRFPDGRIPFPTGHDDHQGILKFAD